MNKKLPSVFANNDLSHVKNNNTVYYSNKKDLRNEYRPSLIGQNVNQKINSIFNSNNYVYKAEVEITFDDKIIETVIIGKQNNYLITLNNQKININDIVDINYKKTSH